MQHYLRKYGVQTIVNFYLFEVDGVAFRTDAADGGSDCNIRKDQGADATCVNDFVDEGIGYSLTITATEMEAAEITLPITDTATKVWLDEILKIETYGHASAQHSLDLDDADGSTFTETGGDGAQLTEAGGTGDHLTAINLPNQTMDITGSLSGSVGSVTGAVGSVTGHTNQTGDNYARIGATGSGLTSLAQASLVTAARMGALTDWINGGRLDLLLDAIKAITDALPDAGALTTIGTDTARLTAVRAAVLDDWINAGRLDLLLDAIKVVTDALPDAGALTTIGTDTARLTAVRAAILTDWINGGRLDLLLDAVKATIDAADESIPYNDVFNFSFRMVDATDGYTLEPGLTVTGTRSIDGAAFTNIAGTIAETAAASGVYRITGAAADSNGVEVVFKFASAGARTKLIFARTRVVV